ncbi:MAG TPA: OmpA family protein [Candidatus Kapabacteria bacterium]|nr:OmpA family protein [Candidatus Kapabacteria bacterium]HPO63030.1 OmpA family protein [Candidatus Kapabacteria bacterium]
MKNNLINFSKSKILIILLLCLFLCWTNTLISQSILKLQLSQETVKQWDEYIMKYAPSDSSLKVVQELANRHFISGRAAVSFEVFQHYKQYFKRYEEYFSRQIKLYEEYMLIQTPAEDTRDIYVKYITEHQDTFYSYIALQRLAENFIEKKQWDSASAVFKEYKKYFKDRIKDIETIIKILDRPEQEISIKNIGPSINSKGEEWDPCPTPDGKYLFFSGRNRPNSYIGSDVFFSKFENGNWSKSQILGPAVNGTNDETIDNISPDNTTLLLSGTFEGTFGNFDIYTIEATENSWEPLKHLPYPINTPYTDEGSCISSDGKAIIFTSDRPGGTGDFVQYNTPRNGSAMGNMDFYVCIKTENGWSDPINLGNVINTPYAERSPYLHPDGKTLYFSSDGHPGLGRLDVFKSVRLNDSSWTEWSKPINLGKEINTAKDDWGYKVVLTGDSAIFASQFRNDGFGGWDIYSVSLTKDLMPSKVITIKGKVTDQYGKPLSAELVWENLNRGENEGILKSNPQDGSYIIFCKPGAIYGYYASKKGYYPTSNNVDLTNIQNSESYTNNIVLFSLQELIDSNISITVNNIFFDFDKYELKNASNNELNRISEILKEYRNYKIEIAGHTDSVGTKEYNIILSQNRADAVKNYLIRKGIENNRIHSKGFGNEFPVESNQTEEGRAKNRRVEIKFKL